MSAILPGRALDTPGEAYRTGFRDGATAALAACVFIAVIAMLAGCDDADRMRQIAQAEQNARVAEACKPAHDERRVVEWAVIEGEVVLTVTVQRYTGRKNNTLQYVILSETEIR